MPDLVMWGQSERLGIGDLRLWIGTFGDAVSDPLRSLAVCADSREPVSVTQIPVNREIFKEFCISGTREHRSDNRERAVGSKIMGERRESRLTQAGNLTGKEQERTGNVTG